MKPYLGVVAALALAIPMPTLATTFDLTSSWGYENNRSYSADGINLNVSGYTGGLFSDISATTVGSFGSYGLGAEYAYSPNHALDNENNYFDMLLFNFDEAVSLDSTSIGWWTNDSDMTILAYTGAGNAADSFSGKTWGEAITSDSWSGNHFTDVAQHGSTVASNPAELTATSWLIGTFLAPVDALFERVGSNNLWGPDYVKLTSISVSKPSQSVPEIDGAQTGIVLALLAGFMACIRERRRKV